MVGFTTINQGWASYSPVKNCPADALVKSKEGNPTHSATTGELDFYYCGCKMLEMLCGAEILPAAVRPVLFNGISVEVYPRSV